MDQLKLLSLLLVVVVMGSCQPDVNTSAIPERIPNPTHDTLWSSQRTSYRVSSSFVDRSKIQMFIGTRSVKIELLFDGEMFIMAPPDSGSGIVRLYYDGVPQSFDVESIVIRGRKGSDGLPFSYFGVVYPGQTIAIPTNRHLARSKVNLFINDQEISIDSIRHDDLIAWADIDVIYFTQPQTSDTSRLTLRVDSAAFVWDPYVTSAHTGNFLNHGVARQLIVKFSGLAATGVVHTQVDTGWRTDPQPTAQGDFLTMGFEDMPTIWKGDSLIVDFSKTKYGRTERVNIRLLTSQSHNYVSGIVEFEQINESDSTYFFVELDKSYWRIAERSYWFGANDYAVTRTIRKIKYYERYNTGFYELEAFKGGTGGSTVTIGLDAVK